MLSLSKSSEAVEKLFSLNVTTRLDALFSSFPNEITAFLVNASSVYPKIAGGLSKDFMEKILASRGEHKWRLFGNLCKCDPLVLEFLRERVSLDKFDEHVTFVGFEHVLCDLSSDINWIGENQDYFGKVFEFIMPIGDTLGVVPCASKLGILKNFLFHDKLLQSFVKQEEESGAKSLEVMRNWLLTEEGEFYLEDEQSRIILIEAFLVICRTEAGRKLLRKSNVVSFD